MSKLKRQEVFYDNVTNGPIPPDGYVRGWMFFETCIADDIDKIELECHDKEEKVHRIRTGTANMPFGGQFAAGASPDLAGRLLDAPLIAHYEHNPEPQSPEIQAYMRGMFEYISIYGNMRPKPGEPQKKCNEFKP